MYPVSESLLCLASQRTRFISGAVFFTWGSHSWQKNTSYFFAHPSFRAAILKAILSFHRINHSEIFVEQSQLIMLDCFQQETYSQSQDRRHYFTLSGWPSLSFQTWAGVIVLFWIKNLLGFVVWVYEAQTFPCGQIDCWTSFHCVSGDSHDTQSALLQSGLYHGKHSVVKLASPEGRMEATSGSIPLAICRSRKAQFYCGLSHTKALQRFRKAKYFYVSWTCNQQVLLLFF